MSLKTVIVVACVTLLALGIFWAGYTVRGAAHPPTLTIITTHDSTVRAESARVQVDTLWRTTSATVGISLDAYQTLRAQLESALARGPVVITNVDRDTNAVMQALRQCDTTIRDCASARDAAVAMHRADSVVMAAQERELAAYRATPPTPTGQGPTRRLMERVGVYTGYGVPASSWRPSMQFGVGVRVWP